MLTAESYHPSPTTYHQPSANLPLITTIRNTPLHANPRNNYPQTTTRSLALLNTDGGNALRDKMASYYSYLSAGIDTSVEAPVRWSETQDVLTSQMLMAGCLPVFDRTKSKWIRVL